MLPTAAVAYSTTKLSYVAQNTFKYYEIIPFLRQRPYHVECTSSRPITEVKQHWAALVLGWVTAWEYAVLYTFYQFSA